MRIEEFRNLEKGQIIEYRRYYWPSEDKYSLERGLMVKRDDDGDNAIVNTEGRTIVVYYEDVMRVCETWNG